MQAERSVTGWVAAAVPAVGFLVMVKIALVQAGSSSVPQRATVAAAGLSGSPLAPVEEGAALGEPARGLLVAVREGQVAGEGQVTREGPRARSGAGPAPDAREVPLPVAGGMADAMVVALVPVARAVADVLEGERRRLSRQALAAGLRERGHPVSNARVCDLLRILRSEPVAVRAPGGAVSAASVAARRKARAPSGRHGSPPARQIEGVVRLV